MRRLIFLLCFLYASSTYAVESCQGIDPGKEGDSKLIEYLEDKQYYSTLMQLFYRPELNLSLLGDNRDQFVKEFVVLLESVFMHQSEGAPKIDNLMFNFISLIENQQISNPEHFVSHGPDHSLRVMDFMLKMNSSKMPLVQESLTNLYAASRKTDEEKARVEAEIDFAVALVGLLHDVGYSDLEFCDADKIHMFCKGKNGIGKKAKFLHSLSSANIFEKTIAQRMKRVLTPQIVEDINYAIRYHNYDVKACDKKEGYEAPSKCSFTIDDEHTKTLYLSPGNHFRQYEPAYLDETPLLFMVRVADNADFRFSRLTPPQRSIKTVLGNLALQEGRKPNFETMSPQERSIVSKSNEYDFFHNYSNWIARDVVLREGAQANTYEMDVDFLHRRTPDCEAIPPELRFERHVEAAVFQITRMADSLESTFLSKDNPEPFSKNITVNLQFGLSHRDEKITMSFPLQDFLEDRVKEKIVEPIMKQIGKPVGY